MVNVEKLIPLVHQHRILYDYTHPEYRNCQAKDKIWAIIAKQLKVKRVDNVKKKWKNLRDTYVKTLKNTNTEIKKEWTWAFLMKDFLPYVRPPRSKMGLTLYEDHTEDPANLLYHFLEEPPKATKKKKYKKSYAKKCHDEHEEDNISVSFYNFLEIQTSDKSNDNIKMETYANNHALEEHEDEVSNLNYEQEALVDKSNHMIKFENSIDQLEQVVELQSHDRDFESTSYALSTAHDPIATGQNNDRKHNRDISTSTEEFVTYMKDLMELRLDEIDSLLLSYGKTIKKFSPNRQALTKFKISQLIMEQEVLHLQEYGQSTLT